MGLGEWIGIVGVLTTLVVGIPVYLQKPRDRPPSASELRVNVEEQVNICQRVTNVYPSGGGHGSGLLLATSGAGILVASLVFWLVRPYLLVAWAGICVAIGVLTCVGQRWTRSPNRRAETVALSLALGLSWADLVLLAFPGLPWGDGFRLGWTFHQGAHLHGPGFVLSPLLLFAALTAGLLMLALRCATVLAATAVVRSPRSRGAMLWRLVTRSIGVIGCRSRVLWTAPLFPLFGLIAVIASPYLHPGSFPIERAPPPARPVAAQVRISGCPGVAEARPCR